MNNWIKINAADNIVVCLADIRKGEIISVDNTEITVLQDTPRGHKITITDLKQGENIIKYGYPIGHVTIDVKAGEWVNENNIHTNLSGILEYKYQPTGEELNIACDNRTFNGYRRKNGDVGIRNEIWLVPTVGCVNGVAEKLADMFRRKINGEDSHSHSQCNIDAVWSWHHNYGCSQLSDDHEATRKVLRDIVLHPNAGGVLIVSLGCENNQPDAFMELLGDYDKERIKLLVVQQVEGDEIEVGMEMLESLYDVAKHDNVNKSHFPNCVSD